MFHFHTLFERTPNVFAIVCLCVCFISVHVIIFFVYTSFALTDGNIFRLKMKQVATTSAISHSNEIQKMQIYTQMLYIEQHWDSSDAIKIGKSY